MRTNKRITHAYCVEAHEELTISAARQFYFSRATRGRLNFLCSSEACREQGVKVTGVNYDLLPEEQSGHVAAHYRENSTYEHDASCEWVDLEAEATKLSKLSPEARTARQIRQKLKDCVDVFDPEGAKDSQEASERKDETAEVRSDDGRGVAQSSTYATHPRNSSSSLERLVHYYLDAKATLSEEELGALKIRVMGRGEMPLRFYFRSMRRVREGINDRVVYGGARYTPYGEGFRFDFYDKFNDQPISMYVPPKQMRAYRFRRYLEEILSQHEEVKYFTVYALGRLVPREEGREGYAFEVEDLRNLVVIRPKKEGGA